MDATAAPVQPPFSPFLHEVSLQADAIGAAAAAAAAAAPAKRGSVVSLLAPPPLSLLPLAAPASGDLFGAYIFGESARVPVASLANEPDDGSGSGAEDDSCSSCSSSGDEDGAQLLSDCDTDDDASRDASRRSSAASSKQASRRCSSSQPTSSLTSSAAGAEAHCPPPPSAAPLKAKRRYSILSFASLHFSPKTLLRPRRANPTAFCPSPVTPAAESPQGAVTAQESTHSPCADSDDSAPSCSARDEPLKPAAASAAEAPSPRRRTHRRPKTSPAEQSGPLVYQPACTLSLLGMSVPDLVQPPSALPVDIEPILKLPPQASRRRLSLQDTTQTGRPTLGSPASSFSSTFSGSNPDRGAAGRAGTALNAAVGASASLLRTTVGASVRVGAAMAPMLPPGSKKFASQAGKGAVSVMHGVKGAGKSTARIVATAGGLAPKASAAAAAPPTPAALAPVSPTRTASEAQSDYFMRSVSIPPSQCASSIGKAHSLFSAPGLSPMISPGTSVSVPPSCAAAAPSAPAPASPLASRPSKAPATPTAETMQVLRDVGWTLGSAAARAFDHPPHRQKRLSIVDIDDDMLDAAENLNRIPSQDLDPFVFNSNDPEIQHWTAFAAAYAAGEIDLNNGLPAQPPRGVPDASLCPYATPLGCGPFRAPKPVWEQERQRAVRRLEVSHIDAQALQAIAQSVQKARAALNTAHARCDLIDGDDLISLTPAGATHRAGARATSLAAHTILNRNHGMVVADTQQDWRFPDAAAMSQVMFYAGAPIIAANGMPVGCLSVWDAQARTGLSDEERAALNAEAKAIGKELEAYLVRRFEAKIARMNNSFDHLGKVGEEVEQVRREVAARVPTPALGQTARLEARRGSRTTTQGSEFASRPLRRSGSQPSVCITARSAESPSTAKAVTPQHTTPAEIICLGLLVQQDDAALLDRLVQLIRTTLDMSIVYLAGVALDGPGTSASPLGQRCILAACDMHSSRPSTDLQLDYSLHAKAAASKHAPIDEGVVVQDLDRKALKAGRCPVKAATAHGPELFQAGLLVPVELGQPLGTANADADATVPPIGFVLGAFSNNPSKSLGIEDLRYLQNFALIFSTLLTRYRDALDRAVEEARQSASRAAAALSLPARSKAKAFPGSAAVKKVPKVAIKTTVAVSKGAVAVGQGSAQAVKTATTTTFKALAPPHVRLGPRSPSSPKLAATPELNPFFGPVLERPSPGMQSCSFNRPLPATAEAADPFPAPLPAASSPSERPSRPAFMRNPPLPVK